MSHPSPITVSADIHTFMQSNAKSAMRTNIGMIAATAKKVLHVAAHGNNTTANGTPELPYLTAQAAYDAAVALAVPVVLFFGVGSFGNINATSVGWNSDVWLGGMGYAVSEIGTITCRGNINVIRGDGNVYIQQINSSGVTGTTGGAGTPGNVGENGGIGATADEIQLSGIVAGSVVANGGTGGAGGAGGSTDEGYGQSGGSGGGGGNGATITMSFCKVGIVQSLYGGGGLGGPGGPGPEGDGSPGSDGSSGSSGDTYIYHSMVGELTSANCTYANSSIETIGAIQNNLASSNAPYFLP